MDVGRASRLITILRRLPLARHCRPRRIWRSSLWRTKPTSRYVSRELDRSPSTTALPALSSAFSAETDKRTGYEKESVRFRHRPLRQRRL